MTRPAGGHGTALTVVRLASVAAVVLAIGAVAAGLASVTDPGTALAAGPQITGGGSSYAAVAIEQWSAEVSTLYGDSVNFTVSSSVQGLNEFSQGLVSFAASEIGYSTGQASYNPPAGFRYQYLPDVAGATCLMYNLKSITGSTIGDLRLDPNAMALIFSGQIKYWDSPPIRAINPGVLLPHEPIIVVWREDPSGDNYLFSQYLAFEQPQIWNSFAVAMGYPPGHDAQWPFPQRAVPAKYDLSGWIGAQGSDIASNDVAGNAGAITYVETAYAKLHNTPCAYVKNASGTWVGPSSYDDAVALTGARLLPDLEQQLDGVYTNKSNYAYPISAYSYLVTQERQEPAGQGAVLGRFIRYLACTGQQAAGQLGYSPLPPNLVADDFAAIDRINGAARAPLAPTAANCQNPYVDGQTPLPGQPTVQGQASGSGTTTTTLTRGGGSTPTTRGSDGKSGGAAGATKRHRSTTAAPAGANVLPSTGPSVARTVAGLALLGAVGRLQRQLGPRPGTSAAMVLAAIVVLSTPPIVLARRRRAPPERTGRGT